MQVSFQIIIIIIIGGLGLVRSYFIVPKLLVF